LQSVRDRERDLVPQLQARERQRETDEGGKAKRVERRNHPSRKRSDSPGWS